VAVPRKCVGLPVPRYLWMRTGRLRPEMRPSRSCRGGHHRTLTKGNKTGKVRQQKVKEIRVRPKTGDHDVGTKVVQARKFLEHNDKVQVTVLFRGREMQHQQEGRRVLDSVLEQLAAVGKVERPPTMDGKKMTALIMPNKSAAKPRPKPESVKPTP
jgi:translation initiation factor IF-3